MVTEVSRACWYVFQAGNGDYWFGSDGQGVGTGNFGACRYDGRSFGWLYEQQLTMTPGGGSFGIRSINEDKDGAFLVSNARYRFQVKANQDGKVVYTRVAGIDPRLTGGEELYFQGAVKDGAGNPGSRRTAAGSGGTTAKR